MDKNIAINLKNIRKTYLLHHEKPTFVESVIKKRNSEIFIAIDNLNLKINKGERVGIMGSNGSGKTTLLKLMSHITVPDQGEVFTKGRVVSLIDLNAGFHPDLTGEENIFLNGLVLGLTRQEIIKNYKNIIEFADINKFIDSPLYTYSSGMRLRLGFSVAIHSNPDILVLDENISVGDQDFKTKIDSKINELSKMKKTIVLVTQYKQYLEK
jgi:ABC-type polysaccharide/polyol phosphate transport system ATPase subunit